MLDALRPVGLIAAYLVLAKLGLVFAFVHGVVSPVWLASGLAVGALALWGLRLWPAVAIGAFLADFLLTGHPPLAAAGVAAGHVAEAVLGAAILQRAPVRGEISRVRDALAVAAAAAVAPVPSAAITAVSLVPTGLIHDHDAVTAALVWWLGGATGVLLVAPLMLAWFGVRSPAQRTARPAEVASVFLVTLAIAVLYFASNIAGRAALATLPPGAFLFPPAFWAILRFRPRNAILIIGAACAATLVLGAAKVPVDVMGPVIGIQLMVFTVGGGALAMLGAITDAIRIQTELRNSQEHLAYALSAGSSGAFDWDARTDRAEWSDEMLALYGLRPGEYEGRAKDWLEYVVPEYREAAQSALEKSLQTGEFNLDFQIRRRDTGELRWIAGRARINFDSAGRPVRMMGVNTDITDRKTAELALKESEAQLKAIVDHAPVGIAYLSLPERRILWVNPAMGEITGYRQEELLGMTSFDLTLPDDRFIARHEYDMLAAGELRNFAFEKRYTKKDGSTIWAHSSVSAVYGDSSKAAFAVNIIENITAAKLADAARRDAEQRLQLAVDIAELGSWEFQVDDGHVFVALSWQKRLGIEEENIHAVEQWRSHIHPDDRKRVLDYLNRYVAHPEGTYQIEYRFRYGDGTYHWLSSRAVPVADADGRLQKLIGTHLDVTDRKRAEQRIREESLHDPLTGLPNRGLILEYGAHLLSATQRSQGHCAVLFIDLDRFKPINDTYGHEAGDAVLKETARRLRGCTRREDLVGRLGGDEFVIVLPHVDYQHHRVDTVARHVLNVVSRPIPVGFLNLAVSPSIGVAYFPDHGSDMETLIEKADMAMYRAKEQGRANCQTYTPDLERRSEQAAERKSSLQNAMQRGNLALYYQPIVNLRTGRLVAAEALLRMMQPDGKMVGPSSLLPKSESSDLGFDLDQWVLANACRQHADWMRQGLEPILLSVNVSPMQMTQPAFAEALHVIVSKTGMAPSLLQIEVPEKAIEGNGATSETFQQIKSVGVRIALDGFGAGALNLNQLTNLPIDCIKMEPSLVRRMASEPTAAAAVSKLIVALGRILQLEVVGAGVESEDILRSVQESGCDEAQGFYFSRPLPPADFANWYRRHQLH